MDDAVRRLLDKQEITEVLTRYMRAVDRVDLDALRACHLPGAVEEHGGVFTGPADEYVDGVARTLTRPRPSRRTCCRTSSSSSTAPPRLSSAT